MKKLKFAEKLVPLILSGEKTSTWRLFDDKDLSVGDKVEFINSETGDNFADVKIISVGEKTFADITEADFETHETYSSKDEMLKTYRGYYGEIVDKNTKVKIIKFKLIQN
ncbi:MAG: ASCH domain-containing protein [Candidatus Berkelbacteria bacterium]|nr:ASCH domain-containing protein [Candidatus Berkelbacteria bacterium]